MKLWVLITFAVLLAPAHSQTAFKDFKDNQEHFNKEEHDRNDQARVEMEGRISDRIRNIDIDQKVQDANIKALEGSARDVKGLGVIIIFITPLCVTWIYHVLSNKSKIADSDLIAHDKIRDKILERLGTLERESLMTQLQMPLMTELAQEMTAMIVEVVHHPDDSHVRADDLLDKVGGTDMTHADTHALTSLMMERSGDTNVTQRERDAAGRLPKMMSLVKQLIAIQSAPIVQTSYEDRLIAQATASERTKQ